MAEQFENFLHRSEILFGKSALEKLKNTHVLLAGAGGAPLASIALGKNDKDHAEKIMTNSFLLLLIFAASPFGIDLGIFS